MAAEQLNNEPRPLREHMHEFSGYFHIIHVVQRTVSLPAFLIAFVMSVISNLPDMPPSYPALAYANLAVFIIPFSLLIFEALCLFPFASPGMYKREKNLFFLAIFGVTIFFMLWSALYVVLIKWTNHFGYNLDAQLRIVQMLWFATGGTAAFVMVGNILRYFIGTSRTYWFWLFVILSVFMALTMFLPIWIISLILYYPVFRGNNTVAKYVRRALDAIPI